MNKKNLHNENLSASFYHNLIEGRTWAIDKRHGLQIVSRLLAKAEFSKKQAVVDFKAQKEALAPKLLVKKSEGYTTIDKWSMNDSDTPYGSVLELQLSGAMTLEGDWCSYGAYDYERWIAEANKSSRISGIFIRANSPGGEPLAGQTISNAIKDFKKPKLGFIDVCASACYLALNPADELIASGPQSEIGSIGVYSTINKTALARYVETYDTLYSEKSPNKNKAILEYIAGNPDLIIQEATQADELFMSEVMKNRYLMGDAAMKEDTLSGHLFFAEDAINRGLIDGIGSKEYALMRLDTLIKSNSNTLKKYL